MATVIDIGENQFETVRKENKRLAVFFYRQGYGESEKALENYE